MADQQNNGQQSGFFKNILNKLPYQTVDFNKVLSDLNPKYQSFEDVGMKRTEALAKNSIFFNNEYNNAGTGQISVDGNYSSLVYANVEENKGGRLQDYRIMASFAEISDALDQICDECINKDSQGNVINLILRNTELQSDIEQSIKDEFEKYIEYFDLERKGFEYFRQLLVEGEVYFEHIIHKQYTDDGILGVAHLPSDLIDPIYDNIQNMLIKGYILRKPIFDPTQPGKIDKFDFIPMDDNQVSYINSGIWNQDKTFRLPYIENARRAYRQLSLVEDSIVIYRLVRAPERLVFNVDVGNMAPPKAEAYLRKLIQEYWSKKTFDSNQSGQVQKFNPQSMLDSFWFAKRAGSEGTSVTQLPGGANLGELADLMYFVNKLYKALKVPTNRLNPDSTFSDGDQILREELKFAKFIIRLQQHFAQGIKNGFLTHLKLRDMFTKYDIRAQNIHLEFNVPTNFYEMRESQKLALKVDNFNSLATNEYISATYSQKKYLSWSDTEIKANREFLRKDKELEWELAQITNGGPNWRDDLEQAAAPGGEVAAGGEAGGMPPEFGGGEADIGGDVGGEEPVEVAPDESVPEEPVA
tara:strand:+ start:1893 stop:3644 length:1752 start_codon:yes stop_codon:yes gene_type:complete